MSERRSRYLAPLPLGGDEGPPWSKGLMARALAATGLKPTRAYELARRADADMSERRSAELDLDRLAEVAAETLGEAEASRTMRRLRRLQALQHLEHPVVLLVGGATGTGKSTIATEVTHRLGITRVTSTDFIRQTMRAFFSREFMPSVHYSSFEAELALSRADEDVAGDATLLGFLDQTRNVLVGVEAAIDRSLTEGWSMALEGVHLVPGMVAIDRSDALVVHCVIAISDEQAHRSHFWVRDAATDGLRPLEKYLDGMTEIRMIQDVLVERARRCDVPVIENVDLDDAIGDLLDLVLTGAERLARLESGRGGVASAVPRRASRARTVAGDGHRRRCHRGAPRRRGSGARHGHRRDRPLLRGGDRGPERQDHPLADVDGVPGRPDDPGGHPRCRRRVAGSRQGRGGAHVRPPWTPDRMSEDAKFILGFG